MNLQCLEALRVSWPRFYEKEPVLISEGKREADSRAAHKPLDDKYPPYGQNDSLCLLVREVDTLCIEFTVIFLIVILRSFLIFFDPRFKCLYAQNNNISYLKEWSGLIPGPGAY